VNDFRRADRAAVADELARARAAGRLTEAEYGERVRRVAAADSYAELVALTGDLPPDAPRPPARRSRGKWVVLHLAVTAVNLVAWGALCLVLDEPVHPWWVWIALLGGLLVLLAP